jgi:cell division protein FtsW
MRTRGHGRRPVDYSLIVIVAALLVVGLMMTYSSTFDMGVEKHSDTAYYLKRQFRWLIIGLVTCLIVARLEYHLWPRASVLLMGGALVLLCLVLVVGVESGGAQRTLVGRSVQPSEVAKLAVVVYIAHWLSSKGEQIKKLTYGLIPFSVLVGLVAALIVLQPDFSTAILIVVTAAAMFYLAGADLMQLFGAFFVGVLVFGLIMSRSDHASARIEGYVSALRDPITGSGLQLMLAIMALASGGFLGEGLGQGDVELVLAHTDSVFAVVGEELGFVGCLLVIGLYAGLAYRGFHIASQASDSFGAMLAAGTTCWMVFQAFMNVAVITGLIPFTGIPLPFISLGGSSLVACLAGIGFLLSVSRGSVEKGIVEGEVFALGRRNGRARLSRTRRGQSAQQGVHSTRSAALGR